MIDEYEVLDFHRRMSEPKRWTDAVARLMTQVSHAIFLRVFDQPRSAANQQLYLALRAASHRKELDDTI